MIRRRVLQSVAGGLVTGVTVFGTYMERPIPDVKDGIWYDARGQTIYVNEAKSWRKVDERGRWETWLSEQYMVKEVSALGLGMMRTIIIPIVSGLGHLALRLQNELYISDKDDTYSNLVDLIARRDHDVGLLTISNHTSVLDDPFLLAAISPIRAALDSERARWAACSQEVCYARGAFFSAFFSAGKTLPIKRGGGLDQPALKVLAAKLSQGNWVHLFPEGHVYQGQTIGSGLGSHQNNERPKSTRAKIGSLKWGTAKLIAHAPEDKLIVVPFIHDGMSKIMPYDTVTGKCKSKIWRSNQRLTLSVGHPLKFDDLIRDHKRRLKKKQNSFRHYSQLNVLPDSTDEDKILYTQISQRMEAALVALQAAHHLQHHQSSSSHGDNEQDRPSPSSRFRKKERVHEQ